LLAATVAPFTDTTPLWCRQPHLPVDRLRAGCLDQPPLVAGQRIVKDIGFAAEFISSLANNRGEIRRVRPASRAPAHRQPPTAYER
jgi:hypothetical protein